MTEQTGETTYPDGRVVPNFGERRRLVTIEFYTHESAPVDDVVVEAVKARLSDLSFIFDTSDLTVTVEPIEVIYPKQETV